MGVKDGVGHLLKGGIFSGTYGIYTYIVSMSLSHNHEKSCAGQCAHDFITSLVAKPMTMVIGLGTRLDVYMCTR